MRKRRANWRKLAHRNLLKQRAQFRRAGPWNRWSFRRGVYG